MDSLDTSLEWEQRSSSTPFLLHAVAGSCAGWTEHSATYPIDTLKTRLQTTQVLHLPNRLRQALFQERGFFQLWRGLPAVLAASIPAHAALFSVYEITKAKLPQHGFIGDLSASLSGAAAVTAHDLVMTPADVVKQRLQMGAYRSIPSCIGVVLRTEGLAAFYRSLPVTLFMNAPQTGLMLMCHNRFKRHILQRMAARSDTPVAPSSVLMAHFGSAGVAGALAGALTTPLDVVKTRMQTQQAGCWRNVYKMFDSTGKALNHATASPSETDAMRRSVIASTKNQVRVPKYTSVWSTVRTLLREEGATVLWRGAIPRALVAAPGTALCWGGYETSKTLLAPWLGGD